jgi:hypothetical protein
MEDDGTGFIVGLILGILLAGFGGDYYWSQVTLSKEAFARCEGGELHILDWNQYECRYDDRIVTFKVGE